jgi:hypothetical protein
MGKVVRALRRALNIYGADRNYIWYLYHNI